MLESRGAEYTPSAIRFESHPSRMYTATFRAVYAAGPATSDRKRHRDSGIRSWSLTKMIPMRRALN